MPVRLHASAKKSTTCRAAANWARWAEREIRTTARSIKGSASFIVRILFAPRSSTSCRSAKATWRRQQGGARARWQLDGLGHHHLQFVGPAGDHRLRVVWCRAFAALASQATTRRSRDRFGSTENMATVMRSARAPSVTWIRAAFTDPAPYTLRRPAAIGSLWSGSAEPVEPGPQRKENDPVQRALEIDDQRGRFQRSEQCAFRPARNQYRCCELRPGHNAEQRSAQDSVQRADNLLIGA